MDANLLVWLVILALAWGVLIVAVHALRIPSRVVVGLVSIYMLLAALLLLNYFGVIGDGHHLLLFY